MRCIGPIARLESSIKFCVIRLKRYSPASEKRLPRADLFVISFAIPCRELHNHSRPADWQQLERHDLATGPNGANSRKHVRSIERRTRQKPRHNLFNISRRFFAARYKYDFAHETAAGRDDDNGAISRRERRARTDSKRWRS